jgi:hypothetical protein
MMYGQTYFLETVLECHPDIVINGRGDTLNAATASKTSKETC